MAEQGVFGSKTDDGVVSSTEAGAKSGVFGFSFKTDGAAFGVSGNVNSPDGVAINGSPIQELE